jgi:O-antigen/teichoic acid export membrane protein
MPDFILALVVRSLNLGLMFVVSAVVARHFGPWGKGILVEAQFVPTFLLIVCVKFGMDTAAVILLRKIKELKDGLLSAFLLLTAFSVALVYFLQQSFMLPFWKTYLGHDFDLAYVFIVMWLVPCQLLHDLCSNAILGCRNFRTFTYFKLVQPVMFFSVIITFYLVDKFGSAEVEYFTFDNTLFAYPFTFAVTAVILFVYLKRHLLLRFSLAFPVVRHLIRFGFSVQMLTLLIFLNRRADVVMITAFSAVAMNGIYSVVVSLIEAAWFVGRPLSSMVLDRAVSERDVDSCGRILRFTMFVSSLTIVGLVLFVPLFLIFLGGKFVMGFIPFLILIPGVLLFNIHQILSQVFIARGESKRLIPLMLLGFFINVLLNLLWIEKYELLGVAMASSISYAVIGLGVLYMASGALKTSMLSLIMPRKDDFTAMLLKIKQFKGGGDRI